MKYFSRNATRTNDHQKNEAFQLRFSLAWINSFEVFSWFRKGKVMTKTFYILLESEVFVVRDLNIFTAETYASLFNNISQLVYSTRHLYYLRYWYYKTISYLINYILLRDLMRIFNNSTEASGENLLIIVERARLIVGGSWTGNRL